MGTFHGILRRLGSDDFGCCGTDGVCVTEDWTPTEALIGLSTVLEGGDDGFDGEKRSAIKSYRIRNQEILLLGEYLTFSLHWGNLERGL